MITNGDVCLNVSNAFTRRNGFEHGENSTSVQRLSSLTVFHGACSVGMLQCTFDRMAFSCIGMAMWSRQLTSLELYTLRECYALHFNFLSFAISLPRISCWHFPS